MSSIPTASRRGVLAGASAAFVAGAARAQYIASGVTRPVKTTNGPVIGLVEEGIPVFKGLRYGAAPVGPLRWAPPARPRPWTDRRSPAPSARARSSSPPAARRCAIRARSARR